MADKEYPIPYYKHLHSPKSAHSPKEEKILADDGWSPARPAEPQEYPKTLYSKVGHTVTIGKYPVDGGPINLEAAKAEESEQIEKGYSVKPVPKREITKLPDDLMLTPGRTAAMAESNGRIDALEERVDQISDGMNQILAFIQQSQKPAEPKRGRPAKPVEEEAEVI